MSYTEKFIHKFTTMTKQLRQFNTRKTIDVNIIVIFI